MSLRNQQHEARLPPTGSKSARRSWSIAARLTAWYAGSAFAMVLVATGLLYWALVVNLDREDDRFLANEARELQALLLDRRTTEVEEIKSAWIARQFVQVSFRVLEEDGHVVMESPTMGELLPPHIFPEPTVGDDRQTAGLNLHVGMNEFFRVLTTRVTTGSGPHAHRIVQLALNRGDHENVLAAYRKQLWLVLGVALVVCTGAGYRIARLGIQPIEEVTKAASRIRSTTLHERLQTSGLPAELRALANTCNEMLDRLEGSFTRLSQFSADIAHELRTPVNNLRGEVEVALTRPRSIEEYREVLGSCLEEFGRLSQLIESLLFLARAENAQTAMAKEPVDVRGELTKVHEFYEAAAAEGGITLSMAVSEHVVACVNRTLFQRAVGNLVANALAHTPSGGNISLSAARDGDTVRVEVADSGKGIPPEDLARVFDRFYRVDRARSSASGGIGLGLAIVKGIVALHGGTADITSEDGRGTRVILVFPLG
ncbi:MAG: heavy metal sensor histidine kinase [Pirellulaceae bacterium]